VGPICSVPNGQHQASSKSIFAPVTRITAQSQVWAQPEEMKPNENGVCVYRLNRRKTSSLYYITYGRGQRDLQLWPLPTKLHTGDQVNVPACPALGAFKTQLGGHNIFFAVVLYCHCPLWSIYISYINSAPV
jgi:hypothetical protein